MTPIFIHLDVLWKKNKDVEFPDYFVTPYTILHKEKYSQLYNVAKEIPEFQEDIETIEYWTKFYKNSNTKDMLNNKDCWIMIYEDFSIHDGYHRLTSAKIANKNIVVATFDIGLWKQGKPK